LAEARAKLAQSNIVEQTPSAIAFIIPIDGDTDPGSIPF